MTDTFLPVGRQIADQYRRLADTIRQTADADTRNIPPEYEDLRDRLRANHDNAVEAINVLYWQTRDTTNGDDLLGVLAADRLAQDVNPRHPGFPAAVDAAAQRYDAVQAAEMIAYATTRRPGLHGPGGLHGPRPETKP